MERKSETVSIATSGKHTLLNLVFNIFLSFKNLIWLTWWDFQKPQWIKKFNENRKSNTISIIWFDIWWSLSYLWIWLEISQSKNPRHVPRTRHTPSSSAPDHAPIVFIHHYSCHDAVSSIFPHQTQQESLHGHAHTRFHFKLSLSTDTFAPYSYVCAFSISFPKRRHVYLIIIIFTVLRIPYAPSGDGKNPPRHEPTHLT